MKGSFYALIRKPRGKILGDDLKFMLENVKYISEKIYRSFARKSSDLDINFFHTLIWLGATAATNTIF